MNFRFDDEQRDMQSALRSLLDRQCTATHVRTAWEKNGGRVAGLWDELLAMGVLGILVPEGAGGMGGSMVDAVLLIEEAGRAGLPDPLVETAIVANPLRDAVDDNTVSALVGDAVTEADLYTDGVRTEAVGVESVETIEPGRRLVAKPWTPEPSAHLDAAFERGVLGSAAFLCGLADRILAMTVDYATERQQFGKPIGSYQAVKHHLANVRLKLEFARPAVYRAALTMEKRHVSMAKVLAADAGLLAARNGLQVHGAIGYTWEHDLHLFMKPVWSWSTAYGDLRWHRRRVAMELGLA